MLAPAGSGCGDGDGKGELKRDELESTVLDDAEDELILDNSLCSRTLMLFLLGAEAAECARCGS